MIPVSVTVPQFNSDPQPLFDLVRDPAGFAGVFVFDHLVPLGDPHRPVLEAASTLGAAAAAGSTRVGSFVLRVTMRAPELTAAIAATLEAIAPGRTTIGLGVGDRLTANEAARYGMPTPKLDRRLEVLIETIALIRQLAPNVEVWIGGRHHKIRAIAAELADGWNCWGASSEDFAEEAADVRSQAKKPVRISWGGTVLLAPDQGQLDELIQRRGGAEGALAGDPEGIQNQLGELAQVGDELVVSVVPNRRPNWELLSSLIA
jgi:alkanesulfonate monooxygenase SsuD/methylene tetrahydromethanopterin reductase-like flavin-dependent oxidoreductase (luciferase family)